MGPTTMALRKFPMGSQAMNDFYEEFVKAAKETPRLYFEPLFSLWRFLKFILRWIARKILELFYKDGR